MTMKILTLPKLATVLAVVSLSWSAAASSQELPRTPAEAQRMEGAVDCSSRFRARLGQILPITGLCGKPDRGIRRAKSLVTAPFDDLEEEALGKGSGDQLEVFSFRVPVIQNVVFLQLLEQARLEPESGLQILVVIVRDGQHGEPQLL